MTDYNNTYAPKVQTYDQYKVTLDSAQIAYWHPDMHDFLFLGWKTQEGKSGFLLDDKLVYLLTNRTDEWKIKAL